MRFSFMEVIWDKWSVSAEQLAALRAQQDILLAVAMEQKEM